MLLGNADGLREMLEDRWSRPLPGQGATTRAERTPGRKPRSVEFGMLRQLRTLSYRAEPVMSPARSALVVGDPKSDFVPLPGARDEAKRVAEQLKQAGYRVTTLIKPSEVQVIEKLHADAYQFCTWRDTACTVTGWRAALSGFATPAASRWRGGRRNWSAA